MKAGINQVIVRVKKTRNDEITLNATDSSGNPLVLLKDTDFNPEENAMIYGEVVGVPDKLSALEVTREYDGYPLRNGKYEYNILKYKDLQIEVLDGDRVYFHFHSLDDNSFLYKEDGWLYFTIQYNQIFCAVRGGEIFPIAGYLLVDPSYGDDIEDIEMPDGVVIKGKKSKLGIVYERDSKPKYLEGIVSHVSKYIDFIGIDLKPKDKIFYTLDSDFENEIEGKKYYVMHVWDVFALNNNDVIEPVGPWVMIEAEEVHEKTASGIFLPLKKKLAQNTGVVKKTGSTVQEIIPGDEIFFEGKSPNLTKAEGFVFVKEPDIYYRKVLL